MSGSNKTNTLSGKGQVRHDLFRQVFERIDRIAEMLPEGGEEFAILSVDAEHVSVALGARTTTMIPVRWVYECTDDEVQAEIADARARQEEAREQIRLRIAESNRKRFRQNAVDALIKAGFTKEAADIVLAEDPK